MEDVAVLILSNGMSTSDVVQIVDDLKADSRRVTSHKRRELLWDAYSKISTRVSSIQGALNAMVKYSTTDDGCYAVDVIELTKRQRAVLNSTDILGRKLKPAQEPHSRTWVMAWSEIEAPLVLDDLMRSEPCIYITTDAVYVATRFKRALCRGAPTLRTTKDVEKLISELSSNNPLRSVSFGAHEPPAINAYNVILAGSSARGLQLPNTIGYIDSLSSNDIYGYFLQRRNAHLVMKANALIAQMLTDVGKGLVPQIYASSKQDASRAYKYGVMRKAYVHESMRKFIERAKRDGQVEVEVIRGDVEDTEFGRYGKLVFELYYRADLAGFG